METKNMIMCTFSEDGKYKTFKAVEPFYIKKVGTDFLFEDATEFADSHVEYEITDNPIVKTEVKNEEKILSVNEFNK